MLTPCLRWRYIIAHFRHTQWAVEQKDNWPRTVGSNTALREQHNYCFRLFPVEVHCTQQEQSRSILCISLLLLTEPSLRMMWHQEQLYTVMPGLQQSFLDHVYVRS